MATNGKNTSPQQQYTEDQITYLEPREHIRRRPGMYVGGTDTRALHHLIYEVVDNSVDEALAGRCDTITITLHEDGSVSIGDNGAGIPVGLNKEMGISTLEMVMTKVGAGGKFDNDAYKVSGGLHGVGVSAVNALSAQLVAQVYRDGYLWEQTYVEGVTQGDVRRVRPLEDDEPTGTTITFLPDFAVMEENPFNYQTLANRFREMAFVTGGITITLRDERIKPIPREVTYYFDGGIASFVKYLNRNRTPLHDVIYARKEVAFEDKQGKPYAIEVDVAFQYSSAATTTELAFTNTINTPDGGTHITGLRSAITTVINNHARKTGQLKDKDQGLVGSDTLEGLTAIISVKHPDPQFESQTKVKLLNPEVRGAVSQVVSEAFYEYLELNSREARRIIDKCLTSKRAREAAKKARELVRGGPSLLESSTLPGKLADCSQHGENSEIYIVEGDSAGGCFSGDTKIALADGRNITFEELVAEQIAGEEHFIYTIRNDGQIGLERALHARITKQNTDVIRLTLDNGETITCTPDHKFMLRDGSYKQAIELTTNDALMPLYRKLSDKSEPNITMDKYEMVWDPCSDRWLFTYLLADWYNRWKDVYEETDGDHCHHVDFNKYNNNPTNIWRLPSEEHLALHRPAAIQKCPEIRQTDEFQTIMSERMQVAETRAILSEQATAQWDDEKYKTYTMQKWREFYDTNLEFREKRHTALQQTCYRKTVASLKEVEIELVYLDVNIYRERRVISRDTSILRFDTFCKRYFDDDAEAAKTAVSNYNHRVIKIEHLTEKMDVYDIEVPKTHNFALASGVFVHNSAKQGRDRHFQAILPLRGKILNTERARLDRILDNNEVKAMISALGTGIHNDFDVSKLRYGRVIVMTDADVDGSHIRTLLLTFFFRHMQSLIQEGHLYIAQPPIYLLKQGKKQEYVYPRAGYNDAQLLEIALKNYDNPAKVGKQRYKGLGEMNPDQLWETTMDPANRTLLQVTIEDAAEADRVFDMLMGSSVPPRRRFIQTNAKQVKNLDV